MLDWLNYHHLHYFWMVAKEGGITAAARNYISLSRPSVRKFRSWSVRWAASCSNEPAWLGAQRDGPDRFQYADEIFGLGRELAETIQGRPTNTTIRLTVGVQTLSPS